MRTVTVGSGRLNDIVITGDDQVSVNHCRLMLAPRGWFLADAGSTHGTLVRRGDLTVRVPLGELWWMDPADEILVGHTYLPPFNPDNPTATPRGPHGSPTTNPTGNPTRTPTGAQR